MLADDSVKRIRCQAISNIIPSGQPEGEDLRVSVYSGWVAHIPEIGIIVDTLSRGADEVELPARGQTPKVEYLLVDLHQVRLEGRLIE